MCKKYYLKILRWRPAEILWMIVTVDNKVEIYLELLLLMNNKILTNNNTNDLKVKNAQKF